MKFLALGLMVFISQFLLTLPAKAHVLQADDNIGAILHILPDDNPVSGRQIEYVLSFEDTTSRFSLFNCDCMVRYKLNGEVVATRPLISNYDKDSRNSYTFPGPGVYTLEITGRPLAGAEFQAFDIDFTVRVSSGDIVAQEIPNTLLIGIAGAISLFVLAAYVMESSDKSRKL